MTELELKYGCNPNQKPARIFARQGELPLQVLNGRPGYINFMDALNGWQLVRELAAMLAVSEGQLAGVPVQFAQGAAACVVLASGGYPQSYRRSLPITGLTEGQLPGTGATVYHAGTKQVAGGLVTAGGRVLGVTATADNLQQAVQRAYEGAGNIHFEGAHYRRDIGARALAALGPSSERSI